MYQRKTNWWSFGFLSSRSRLYILDRTGQAQHESSIELSPACTGSLTIALARDRDPVDTAKVQPARVAHVSIPAPFPDLRAAIRSSEQYLETRRKQLDEEVGQKPVRWVRKLGTRPQGQAALEGAERRAACDYQFPAWSRCWEGDQLACREHVRGPSPAPRGCRAFAEHWHRSVRSLRCSPGSGGSSNSGACSSGGPTAHSEWG